MHLGIYEFHGDPDELLPAYEQLYDGRAYVAKDVLDPVKRQVRELAQRHGIADRRRHRANAVPAPLTPPGAEQLSLASALR